MVCVVTLLRFYNMTTKDFTDLCCNIIRVVYNVLVYRPSPKKSYRYS